MPRKAALCSLSIGRRAGRRLGAVPRRATDESPTARTARRARSKRPVAIRPSPHFWRPSSCSRSPDWPATGRRPRICGTSWASTPRCTMHSSRIRPAGSTPATCRRPQPPGRRVSSRTPTTCWQATVANPAKRTPRVRLALLVAAVPCGTADDRRTRHARFHSVLFSRRQTVGERGQRRGGTPVGCRDRPRAGDLPRTCRRRQHGLLLLGRAALGHRGR